MKIIFINGVALLSLIRLIPHIILFSFYKRGVTHYDVARWLKILSHTEIIRGRKNVYSGFVLLMTFHPEFRNLFYKRIGIYYSTLINWLCPKMNTLFINAKNIGPGLFIQHGFATIISAESIGRDASICQQVTIGYTNATDMPTLGDNVIIYAAAIVIGKVKIGNNSKVGANAVVVKDVPDNCTVVGVPAYIVKKS